MHSKFEKWIKFRSGQPEITRKILFGRPGCGSEDNIKIDLKERGLEGVDRINFFRHSDQRFTYAVT
jgi:hypothetical protein